MVFRLPAVKRPNIFYLYVLVLLAVGVCSACQNLSNPVSNSPNYKDDLKALLTEQTKATVYEPQCHAAEDSKSGICEFKAFPQDINIIANAFDMSEIESNKTLQYIHYSDKDSKLGKMFAQGEPGVRAFGLFGKSAKLKSKSGNALEYILLFYRPEVNQASIEIRYVMPQKP